MDGPDRLHNTELAMALCRAHRQWQLSLQTHKLAGFR
jgi:organic radical activating enzyme